MDKHIKFNFHPYKFETGFHAVEKEDNGKKRKYLQGISSGLEIDGHGERMTEKAVKSFMDQANGGDILLYAGKHDVDFVDDIGLLTKAEILSNGDWFTEYRLYDEDDGVGQQYIDRAMKLWKQTNGLPPYKRKRQKGFSIEGNIPEEMGIKSIDESGRRVIDDVVLDGVIVVNRPSYKDSIAHACYKALDEMTPWSVKKTEDNIKGLLQSKINNEEKERLYHETYYKLNEALDSFVREVMAKEDDPNRSQKLEIAFNEYKDLMIKNIFDSEAFFIDKEEEITKSETDRDVNIVFKELSASMDILAKTLNDEMRRKKI